MRRAISFLLQINGFPIQLYSCNNCIMLKYFLMANFFPFVPACVCVCVCMRSFVSDSFCSRRTAYDVLITGTILQALTKPVISPSPPPLLSSLIIA